MKRWLSMALALCLCLALAAPVLAAGSGIAVATTQKVLVDGVAVTFETYALLDENGYQTNYAKLRDVASVLSGTPAQFEVSWSETGGVAAVAGKAYTKNGSEMHTPYSGDRAYVKGAETTEINGRPVALDAIVLNDDYGGGYTYYKLRDLGAALGFTVDWSEKTGVYLLTGASLTGDLERVVGRWTGSMRLDGEELKRDFIATGGDGDMDMVAQLTVPDLTVPVTLDIRQDGSYDLVVDSAAFHAAMDAVMDQTLVGIVAYFKDKLGVALDKELAKQGKTEAQLKEELKAQVWASMGQLDFSDSFWCRLEGEKLLRSETAVGPFLENGATLVLQGADAMTMTTRSYVVELTRR